MLMSAGLTVDSHKLFFKTMFVSLFFKDYILILIIVWHLVFIKLDTHNFILRQLTLNYSRGTYYFINANKLTD